MKLCVVLVSFAAQCPAQHGSSGCGKCKTPHSFELHIGTDSGQWRESGERPQSRLGRGTGDPLAQDLLNHTQEDRQNRGDRASIVAKEIAQPLR